MRDLINIINELGRPPRSKITGEIAPVKVYINPTFQPTVIPHSRTQHMILAMIVNMMKGLNYVNTYPPNPVIPELEHLRKEFEGPRETIESDIKYNGFTLGIRKAFGVITNLIKKQTSPDKEFDKKLFDDFTEATKQIIEGMNRLERPQMAKYIENIYKNTPY